MICSNCGNENKDGNLFCEFCGNRMMQYEAPKKKKSNFVKIGVIVIAALSIIVGALAVVLILKNKDDGIPGKGGGETTSEVSEEASSEEASSEETDNDSAVAVYSDRLNAIAVDKGFCADGTIKGSEYFTLCDDLYDTGDLNAYACNYSDTGILSYAMGDYLDGNKAMIVILNEEDGIHAELYKYDNDDAVFVDDKLLNLNTSLTYYDSNNNLKHTSGTIRFDEMLVGFFSMEYTDHDYSFFIKEIDSVYYLCIYYYRYEKLDVRTDGQYFKMYEISSDGLLEDKEIGVHNECLGTWAPELSVRIDSYDHKNDTYGEGMVYDGLADEVNKSGRDINDYTEEEAAAFNRDNLRNAVQDLDRLLDNWKLSDLKYTGSYDTDDWGRDWEEWYDYRMVNSDIAFLHIRMFCDYKYDVPSSETAQLIIEDRSELIGDIATWWRDE